MRHEILFAIATFFIFAFAANAQEDLPAEQVEVIKNFEVQLEETEKIPLNPVLPPLDTTTKKQTYLVPSRNFPVEYPAPKIRPIAMKAEDLAKVYNAYVKLGAGLPRTFYGEGAYHAFVNEKYDLGLDANFHAANFSGSSVENQKFSRGGVHGRGTYYFDQGFGVSANLGFDANKIHYFGYNFDGSDLKNIPDNRVEQLYNTFDIGAKIFNKEATAADLDYQAGLNFYNRNDNFAASESGVDINAGGTKWIGKTNSFDIRLKADFTWYEDTLKQNLNNYYVQPAFTYRADRFKAKIGLNVAADENDIYVFPDIEASLNITGSELVVFAGAGGDLQKNTFRTLSDYNPYINSRYPSLIIKNTKYYNIYGGIRGNLKVLDYSVQLGYKNADNLALFVVDDAVVDSVQRKFAVLYDDVNIVNVRGTIKANIIEGLEIIGTASYNFHDPDNEVKAWHLPALEINSTAIYTIPDEQLRLKASFYVESGPPFRLPNGEHDNLNTLVDLSIGAEYFVSENIGFFLDINNIFDNERQRWRYYPTYGINVLVGATARF